MRVRTVICPDEHANRRKTFNLKNDFSLSNGKRKKSKTFFSPNFTFKSLQRSVLVAKEKGGRTPKKTYLWLLRARERDYEYVFAHAYTHVVAVERHSARADTQTGGCLIPYAHTTTAGVHLARAIMARLSGGTNIAWTKTGPSRVCDVQMAHFST